MTKKDFVGTIAAETGIEPDDVQTVIQKLLDRMTDALAQGKHIEFRDFGVFDVVVRKARIGRNPRKPEDTVTIPARRVVKFKPGRKMKDTVLNTQAVIQ